MLHGIDIVLNVGIEPEAILAGHSKNRQVILDLNHAAVHRVMHFQIERELDIRVWVCRDRGSSRARTHTHTCKHSPRHAQTHPHNTRHTRTHAQSLKPRPGAIPCPGANLMSRPGQAQARHTVQARAQAQARGESHVKAKA